MLFEVVPGGCVFLTIRFLSGKRKTGDLALFFAQIDDFKVNRSTLFRQGEFHFCTLVFGGQIKFGSSAEFAAGIQKTEQSHAVSESVCYRKIHFPFKGQTAELFESEFFLSGQNDFPILKFNAVSSIIAVRTVVFIQIA